MKKWLTNGASFQVKHFNIMLMYLFGDIIVSSIYFAHNYSLSLPVRTGLDPTMSAERRPYVNL